MNFRIERYRAIWQNYRPAAFLAINPHHYLRFAGRYLDRLAKDDVVRANLREWISSFLGHQEELDVR